MAFRRAFTQLRWGEFSSIFRPWKGYRRHRTLSEALALAEPAACGRSSPTATSRLLRERFR